MKHLACFTLTLLGLAALVPPDQAVAEHHTIVGAIVYRRAQQCPWHGYYYHSDCGIPVSLVAPPTAEKQTHWGWGVGTFQVTTIRHQFSRNWPGPGIYNRGMFRPTPRWPSHTNQFGVYYVRGPW